jgi:endonuclease/exonuclease/phosphatase family metal-dependent hydrolase
MTESRDLRGIDVALLYQPVAFRPLCYEYIEVPLVKGMRPTRDILYVQGLTLSFDTLHVFVVHAPSRFGGEKASRKYRLQVANTLCKALSELNKRNVIVAGDFNDYASSPALLQLEQNNLINVTKWKKGQTGLRGNYRYRGEWHSLDHILLSTSMVTHVDTAYIHAPAFLLEDDDQYGGVRPRRAFQGYRYHRGGFSDHLPLVVMFRRREGN